ncbi:uncharacterized protein BN713_01157 [Clostridium sp. CAG:568]|nr:uncharacterized protein BN713_01157 [Clostridium sp. CAG:568]
MKRTVSKICLAVLWALSLIVVVALIFFGVPYLNDAITCGGVNSIGQFSSKIVELVDGWKLPGLSSQGWIDIFMALIVVILLGISIWPAIVAYKKPKAVIDNDGEVTTKAASVEKNEKKHGFGHFVLAFFAIVVWLLTLIVICGMIAVFVPSIRLSLYDSRTVLYWRKLAVEALSGLSGIPVLGYFALFVVIILVVLIALSVLLGVLAFKKPKEDEDELLAQEQATLLEGAPATVEQVNVEQKVEQKQPIEKVVKNDILHKDERIKRGVFKGLAIFLWIVEGFMLIALIAIAIPPVRHFLTDHITPIGYWAYMIVNNIGYVWFYVGYALIMVVLALLSALFASIGYKKAKVETAPDKELEVGKNDSVVPFVDSNGNFGHVVVKDDSVSPLKKYSDGTLTENQLDMEFDWHNYVHHKPVVRIVLAVVLFFVGAFLVLLRVISYGRFAMFKSLASFVEPVNKFIDRYVLNGLFGAYKNIEIFSIGSHAFTAAQLLDGFFTVLMVYILAFLVLLFATFIAWCFRKPGAVKRANKAREKYLNSIIGHDFDNEFLPSASLNVGASQPKDNATGEAMEIDLDKLGTGVKGFKSIEGNYEGNIVNDSTTSISLNSFESDVLILGKPLFESIADVKVQTQVPAYENIEEFADGQGNVTPVDEIRPSDREPSYWYDKNEPVVCEPVVEEAKSDRPSDKTPDYWYDRNFVLPIQQPVIYESATAASKPVMVETKIEEVVEESKAKDYPTVVFEPRPSDRNPSYWYAKALEVASDKTPDYWYNRNKVKEVKNDSDVVVDEKATVFVANSEEDVIETDLDKRILNAIEPFNLIPVEEAGDKASDKAPNYWYDKNVIRSSDREPDYWYNRNVVEAKENDVLENDFDRRVIHALNPENLTPVCEEGTGEKASDKEPDYWYDKNEIRPSDREPSYWYDKNEPVTSEPVVEEAKSDRPSDKTPDYWYENNAVCASDREPDYWYDKNAPVTSEPVVEEAKSDRPSDKTPDYWYGRNEVKVVEEVKSDSASDKTPDYWYDQNEPEPVIEVIKEIRPSDREPNYWYDKNEEVEQEPVVKELRPSDREPWFWYGDPEPVIEKQPEEVKVEEPVYEFKGERASNFEPEHWYHLAKIDSERRASDEEPEYWYKRNEVKKHPNVKRMGAPIPEPIEDAGFDVEPLSPVQPIKKDEPTPLPEEGEVKPVVVAPVKLNKSDISEVASMDNIKPVEARIVRFQLKKIKGNYKGDLTPEEAFNKAVTNQAMIVTPMLQGQGSNKGSKYLANRASKERADVRRTGYVSAVSVNPEENHDIPKKFDKPVSEFKSIREWAQAKKKFEEEQKLLANSGNEDVVEPVKPIVVVEQAPKPVESKSEASIKKPSPVKASIVEPLDLDDLGDLDPVTPLDPIKNKSKGE